MKMRCIGSIVAVFALMAGSASAVDRTWTGASNTSYNVTNNWSGFDVPDSNDGSIMAGAGDGVSILADGSAQSVNSLQFRLNHKFYIDNTNGSFTVVNNINMGQGVEDLATDVSAIYQSAGSVSADQLSMSHNTTGNATLYELSGGTLALLGTAVNDGIRMGQDNPSTFRLMGDSATVSVKAVTAYANAVFDLQLGATGIDTIDATGLMTISSGAALTIDGSSYTGGAGLITLFSYASRADTTEFTEGISGFTGLDVDVVYSDTKIDLVLIPTGGGNVPPVADSQSVEMFPGTSTNITLTGSDYEESELTYSVASMPAHGTLDTNSLPIVTYTPTNDYRGLDSFTFTVNDGTDESDPATVAITVTNEAPTATAQNYATSVDTALSITLEGNDPDNGPSNLTYSWTDPTNGTLTGIAPDLTYEPDEGYTGADSFTFTVNDGADDSDPAAVTITISGAINEGEATIVIDDDVNGWTQQGAGAGNNLTKDNLVADDGVALWGVSNTADKQGLLYNAYSAIAGSGLPPTIQAGTYTLELRIGNGNSFNFTGLNDISSGVNTDIGAVAGFFSTVGALAQDSKNNMYTEFNGVAGVTYTAPTEAGPIDGLSNAEAATNWVTWTFTWEIAEGSAVIGTDPNFGVYNRTGSAAGDGAAFFDNSILSYDSGGVPPAENFGIAVVSGDVVLSWEGGGSYNVLTNTYLPDPNGWGVATNAPSPITIGIGSAPAVFYKLSE